MTRYISLVADFVWIFNPIVGDICRVQARLTINIVSLIEDGGGGGECTSN